MTGCDHTECQKSPVPEKLKRDLDWVKVILLIHLIALSILGIYFLPQTLVKTWLFGLLLVMLGTLGVTAGAHRLWAHRSYTASTNLKVFLMLCQTLVGQGSIYDWAMQHRIHHKYLGTNYDPYNYKKGFIYSQYTQFIQKPHEDQDKLEAEIDVTDLENDKVVMFQRKYYWLLFFMLHILLPINAPAEYWGETLVNSSVIIGFLRWFLVLNIAWLVHSARNIWALKADEKYPCDSNIVFFVNKTYWIDYHYLAPWDYLTGEFGKYNNDCTSKFIKICAVLGCASELKTIDSQAVKEATYKAVATKRSIYDVLLEVEKVAVEKEYYLKPLNMMM